MGYFTINWSKFTLKLIHKTSDTPHLPAGKKTLQVFLERINEWRRANEVEELEVTYYIIYCLCHYDAVGDFPEDHTIVCVYIVNDCINSMM